MLVTIKYFGMVLEKTNTQQEVLEIPSETTDILALEKIIISKYPTLTELTYNIAQNQKITTKDSLINNGDELAFLPPFAGG